MSRPAWLTLVIISGFAAYFLAGAACAVWKLPRAWRVTRAEASDFCGPRLIRATVIEMTGFMLVAWPIYLPATYIWDFRRAHPTFFDLDAFIDRFDPERPRV